MAATYEDAIAALRKAAEGDGEEAAKARRMLAAMDDSDGEPDGDEPKKEEGEAEGDDEGDKKHDGDEAKSQAIAALAKTGNSLEARVASLELQLEGERKAALRASRPDVAKSVHDALSVLPIAQYSAALGKIEKPKRPNPAATATVPATRGEVQGTRSMISPNAQQMAVAMGTAKSENSGVKRGDNAIFFYANSAKAGE